MPQDLTLPPGVSGYTAGAAGTLEFTRQRVLQLLGGLSPEQLAAVPPGLANSIATLVVHVFATEIKVAHSLQGQTLPADIQSEYLLDQPYNPLPAPKGETGESLTAKIEKSRGMLMTALAGLSDADMEREITFSGGRQVTIRLVLALLCNHQSLHLGHMQIIKRLNG